MNSDWREPHGYVIEAFLEYLNTHSDRYILKGGTALMMCYNLDRFSEDIDLNSTDQRNISKIIHGFCTELGYDYRTAKDTNTVKRFFINYGNTQKPLKIEVSYRERNIDEDDCLKINGIMVYNINTLCLMKGAAYQARDKLRDLYDVCFICNNYWNELNPFVIKQLKINVGIKGVEQFDYIVSTQEDELIDNDKLADDFLEMFDRLDLLISDKDRETISTTEYNGYTDNEEYEGDDIQESIPTDNDEEDFEL